MAKTFTADEICQYIFTKWSLSGDNNLLKINCRAIETHYTPTRVKKVGVRDSSEIDTANKILVFRGEEAPVFLDTGYQFRSYSTEILVHWHSEENLKRAEEELRRLFNDWENDGGYPFGIDVMESIPTSSTILLPAAAGDLTDNFLDGDIIFISDSINSNDGVYIVASVAYAATKTTITVDETTLTTGADTGYVCSGSNFAKMENPTVDYKGKKNLSMYVNFRSRMEARPV